MQKQSKTGMGCNTPLNRHTKTCFARVADDDKHIETGIYWSVNEIQKLDNYCKVVEFYNFCPGNTFKNSYER